MRNERRTSGSGRGDEKPTAETRHGARRLLSPHRRPEDRGRADQDHEPQPGGVLAPLLGSHVLPTGFHRIRHYGLLAKGPRALDLAALRALIAAQAGAAAPPVDHEEKPPAPEATALPACPCCGGRMRIIEIFGRGRLPRTAGLARLWMDTS